jgi:hypothetical protein
VDLRRKSFLSLSEFSIVNPGHEIDRDLNAAINLKQAKKYVVLT